MAKVTQTRQERHFYDAYDFLSRLLKSKDDLIVTHPSDDGVFAVYVRAHYATYMETDETILRINHILNTWVCTTEMYPEVALELAKLYAEYSGEDITLQYASFPIPIPDSITFDLELD